MCGLGGFYNHSPTYLTDEVRDEMENLLCLIEDRGGHSYGFHWYSPDRGSQITHRLGRPSEAGHHFLNLHPMTRYVQMHTRYATKGDIRDHRNTHPLDYHGYIVTHNGVLRNSDELKTISGLRTMAEVDSEAVNHVLNRWGELSLDMLEGSASLVWVNKEDPEEVILWTNGLNPLVMGEMNFGESHYTVWASREDHLLNIGAEKVFHVQPWTLMVINRQGVGAYRLKVPVGAVTEPFKAKPRSRVF